MDPIEKRRTRPDDKAGHGKDEQLEAFRAYHDETLLTTNQAVKVINTDDSLKAGDRGPTLMEDFHFREKLTHFDHERIPERVVHARGSAAHGYFQVYEPMTEYTSAKFLQNPAARTPVFVRFSTVVGSRGSADTVRDVRGFATKFYTEEGNYDLVANNIPIFFIQDAIKFPDLVHAIKPEPNNEIPQASAAHDTFWDFVASLPETAHMIMWLLSDRAIPRSFRMMEGFGVNTFRFVNSQGVGRFVKFHWKPALGVHSLVWDEAQRIAGKDPDFNRRDLWEAIAMGDFPEFELGVQMLDERDEFAFPFDILDATKIWPEELIPVRRVGKMILDRNPDNFFAETEQAAFHPANVVPGIDFTNDPLLQGRLFSYLDTQLIRLGGPNFHEIPINRPVAPVHNNQRDGYHRMAIDVGRISYHPSTIGSSFARPARPEEGGYHHYTEKVEGRKIRGRHPAFGDFFSQATMFWNSMSPPEKQHIVEAFHFEVGKVQSKDTRQAIVDLFSNVDGDLARMIAAGVGVDPPAKPKGNGGRGLSPAVSQADTPRSAKSRRVAILVEQGYSDADLKAVLAAFKQAGVHANCVSRLLGPINSADGRQTEADKNWVTTASVLYDAVYVPGGQASCEALKTQGDAIAFINEAFKHAKPIGASNEGVGLLAASAVGMVPLAGADGRVVSETGVVTVQNTSDLNAFCGAFVDAIAQHRHWAREGQKEMVPA